MARAAHVESVFAPAIREINALESRIVTAEDDADSMLWEQAGQVVAQLDAGLSQRQLAAKWINMRTGEPYSHVHVNYVKQVVVKFTYQEPRPRFRDAYNEIANAEKPASAHVSHNSGNNEWYTPPEYIEAARVVLGGMKTTIHSTVDSFNSSRARAAIDASRHCTRTGRGCDRIRPGAARGRRGTSRAHPLRCRAAGARAARRQTRARSSLIY